MASQAAAAQGPEPDQISSGYTPSQAAAALDAGFDPSQMVWVTQRGNDHTAYVLGKRPGEVLVKWAVSQRIEWIDDTTPIMTELPKRRRGRQQTSRNEFLFGEAAVAAAISKPKSEKKNGSGSKKTKKKATKPAAAKTPAAKAKESVKKPKRRSSKSTKRKNTKARKYPVGTKVYKDFPPFGWFNGEVVGYNDSGKNEYIVWYEDNDTEQLPESEMDEIVVTGQPKDDDTSADGGGGEIETVDSAPVSSEQTAGQPTFDSVPPTLVETKRNSHENAQGTGAVAPDGLAIEGDPPEKLQAREKRNEKSKLIMRIKRNTASQEDKERYMELTGKKNLCGIKIITEDGSESSVAEEVHMRASAAEAVMGSAKVEKTEECTPQDMLAQEVESEAPPEETKEDSAEVKPAGSDTSRETNAKEGGQQASGKMTKNPPQPERTLTPEEKREIKKLYYRIKRDTASQKDKERYLELTGKPDLSHIVVITEEEKKQRLQYFRDYNKKRSAKNKNSNDEALGACRSSDSQETDGSVDNLRTEGMDVDGAASKMIYSKKRTLLPVTTNSHSGEQQGKKARIDPSSSVALSPSHPKPLVKMADIAAPVVEQKSPKIAKSGNTTPKGVSEHPISEVTEKAVATPSKNSGSKLSPSQHGQKDKSLPSPSSDLNRNLNNTKQMAMGEADKIVQKDATSPAEAGKGDSTTQASVSTNSAKPMNTATKEHVAKESSDGPSEEIRHSKAPADMSTISAKTPATLKVEAKAQREANAATDAKENKQGVSDDALVNPTTVKDLAASELPRETAKICSTVNASGKTQQLEAAVGPDDSKDRHHGESCVPIYKEQIVTKINTDMDTAKHQVSVTNKSNSAKDMKITSIASPKAVPATANEKLESGSDRNKGTGQINGGSQTAEETGMPRKVECVSLEEAEVEKITLESRSEPSMPPPLASGKKNNKGMNSAKIINREQRVGDSKTVTVRKSSSKLRQEALPTSEDADTKNKTICNGSVEGSRKRITCKESEEFSVIVVTADSALAEKVVVRAANKESSKTKAMHLSAATVPRLDNQSNKSMEAAATATKSCQSDPSSVPAHSSEGSNAKDTLVAKPETSSQDNKGSHLNETTNGSPALQEATVEGNANVGSIVSKALPIALDVSEKPQVAVKESKGLSNDVSLHATNISAVETVAAASSPPLASAKANAAPSGREGHLKASHKQVRASKSAHSSDKDSVLLASNLDNKHDQSVHRISLEKKEKEGSKAEIPSVQPPEDCVRLMMANSSSSGPQKLKDTNSIASVPALSNKDARTDLEMTTSSCGVDSTTVAKLKANSMKAPSESGAKLCAGRGDTDQQGAHKVSQPRIENMKQAESDLGTADSKTPRAPNDPQPSMTALNNQLQGPTKPGQLDSKQGKDSDTAESPDDVTTSQTDLCVGDVGASAKKVLEADFQRAQLAREHPGKGKVQEICEKGGVATSRISESQSDNKTTRSSNPSGAAVDKPLTTNKSPDSIEESRAPQAFTKETPSFSSKHDLAEDQAGEPRVDENETGGTLRGESKLSEPNNNAKQAIPEGASDLSRESSEPSLVSMNGNGTTLDSQEIEPRALVLDKVAETDHENQVKAKIVRQNKSDLTSPPMQQAERLLKRSSDKVGPDSDRDICDVKRAKVEPNAKPADAPTIIIKEAISSAKMDEKKDQVIEDVSQVESSIRLIQCPHVDKCVETSVDSTSREPSCAQEVGKDSVELSDATRQTEAEGKQEGQLQDTKVQAKDNGTKVDDVTSSGLSSPVIAAATVLSKASTAVPVLPGATVISMKKPVVSSLETIDLPVHMKAKAEELLGIAAAMVSLQKPITGANVSSSECQAASSPITPPETGSAQTPPRQTGLPHTASLQPILPKPAPQQSVNSHAAPQETTLPQEASLQPILPKPAPQPTVLPQAAPQQTAITQKLSQQPQSTSHRQSALQQAPTTDPQQTALPQIPLSECACCPVCGEKIEHLAAASMTWSRPLYYPTDACAIAAINKHTSQSHKEDLIWNVIEANHSIFVKGVPTFALSDKVKVITPQTLAKLAFRHAIRIRHRLDDALLDMKKLRGVFVERIRIAREFVEFPSTDRYLEGRTWQNCSGEVVNSVELRKSTLLLLTYLESFVVNEAFNRKHDLTERLAKHMPLDRWRNMVQLVFLRPDGFDDAWFMRDGLYRRYLELE